MQKAGALLLNTRKLLTRVSKGLLITYQGDWDFNPCRAHIPVYMCVRVRT